MEQGNTGVLWTLPTPFRLASNKALITIRPSGKVHVPKLIEVKGQLCYRKGFLSFTSYSFP